MGTLRKNGFFRQFWQFILYLIVLSAILLSIYVYGYRNSLKKLDGYEDWTTGTYSQPEFPKLTSEQMAMIGWAQTPDRRPANSYTVTRTEKIPDMIRIGFFGCSHVFGSESAPGFDYPNQLLGMFNRAGFDNIEIVNFGVKAFGFYQVYMMWDFLGKNYDLDYVVFMPFYWYGTWRDKTFRYHEDGYAPLHARFVLDGDSLVFVPIQGKTRSEVASNFFAMFPDWDYIRYDYRMPLSLKALLPSFLHNRSNPLYYRWRFDKRDELGDSYAILLDRVAEQSKNLIIIANEEEIFNLRDKVKGDNVYFLKSVLHPYIRAQTSSIYRAPRGHYSDMGNYLRAKELFYLLTGDPHADFRFVDWEEADFSQSIFNSSEVVPLYQYDSVAVAIGSNSVATFVAHVPGKPLFRFDKKIDFKEHQTASLVLMPGDKFKFMPVDFVLPKRAEVLLHLQFRDGTAQAAIGMLRAPQRVVGRVEFSGGQSAAIARGAEWRIEATHDTSSADFILRSTKAIQNVAISVGSESRRFLDCELTSIDAGPEQAFAHNYALTFRSVTGEVARLRATAGQYLNVEALTETSGTIDIVAHSRTLPTARFLIGTYKIREDYSPPFSPPFKRQLSLRASTQ